METSPKKIKLRKFSMQDVPALSKLCNNKKIWDNVRDTMPHPYTEKDAIAFIKKLEDENPQNTFAIEYQKQLVGTIGIHPQQDVYRLSAEIGYCIGEPFWGKGIATEALKQIIDYGFKKLGLNRLYAGCYEYNIASQYVLKKTGFQQEGIFRKAVMKNGNLYDEVRFALIKSDHL